MHNSISDIRPENILSVIEALTQEQHMTRDELSQRCQLSLTTVGKIINRLHDYGVLSQKHTRSAKSGRSPATFSISDSTAWVIFRIGEQDMTMELTDLRLRPLRHIRQEAMPDRDPGEGLISFLLLCRRELETAHKHILLCGLIAENSVLDSEMIIRAIQTHLKLSVTVQDNTADAIARAAIHERISADDRCVAVLSNDGSCGGTIIYNGRIRKGSLSDNLPRSADELLQMLQALTTFFVPDVLLICSTQSTGDLQKQLEASLREIPAYARMVVEVRNTDRFLALGMSVVMRLAWLEEIRQDSYRLRPPVPSHHRSPCV